MKNKQDSEHEDGPELKDLTPEDGAMNLTPQCEAEDDEVLEPDDSATNLTIHPAKAYAPSLKQHQLTETIGAQYGSERRAEMQRGSLRMYHELLPEDVIEDIIARQLVVLNNLAIECFVEFNFSKKNTAVLRHGLKASELTKDCSKLYLALKSRKK